MGRKLAVIDLETDPFKFGRIPRPFAGGFTDGEKFVSFWSPDCVKRIIKFLYKYPEPLIIFAHNGGRFDFLQGFLEYFDSDMKIINGRVIQARMGEHEFRDSYAILPFALETYKKTEIDYAKFEHDVREKHRDEILSYLRDDCVDLWTLVDAFFHEFGDNLTVGGSALRQLKKHHKFDRGSANFDKMFRKDFYFGGRNQVFKSGIIKGPIKMYDVNSSYPASMRNHLHPVCSDLTTGVHMGNCVSNSTCFVVAEGHNYGAFPVRTKTGGLDFTVEKGRFYTTIHEWEAALDTGTFKPDRVIMTYDFDTRVTFQEFVDHFYFARKQAKAAGDKIRELFYKFVLNSAYGKFAQNPDNYFDWKILPIGVRPEPWHDCTRRCEPDCVYQWTPAHQAQGYYIWQRPLITKRFYNICTGASITGASRALLLRGIHATADPLYCDTDSIICRGSSRVRVDDTELGAWKFEGAGTVAAIAGKKLYAVFAPLATLTEKQIKDITDKHTGELRPGEIIPGRLGRVKKAHKGARLTAREIYRIAQGEVITCENPVPGYKLDGTITPWAQRTRVIRKTA